MCCIAISYVYSVPNNSSHNGVSPVAKGLIPQIDVKKIIHNNNNNNFQRTFPSPLTFCVRVTVMARSIRPLVHD